MAYADQKTGPSPQAVAVTALAHVGIAWIALNVAGVVPGPIQQAPPIIFTPIEEKTEKVQPPPDPDPIIEDVKPIVPPPLIELEKLPKQETPIIVSEVDDIPRLPPITPGTGQSDPFVAEPPAPPVFVGAELDRDFLSRFQPPYPGVSQRRDEEGTVVIEVTVLPNGRAADARVVTSSGFSRLDEAAIRHANKSWRFLPATEDGKPVASKKRVTVTFDLQDA